MDAPGGASLLHPLRRRASSLLWLLILPWIQLSGCGNLRLDGTWRHAEGEGAGLPAGGYAYELVLAQYGPDVAGLVRTFAVSEQGAEADPYLRELDCTVVENGRVSQQKFRFEFQHPSGSSYIGSFDASASGESLTGWLYAAEEPESPDVFTTLSWRGSSVDRDCGLVSDPFVVSGHIKLADEAPLSPDVRVALVYTGLASGGGRFTYPAQVTNPYDLDTIPQFAMTLAPQPAAAAYTYDTSDGELRFAFGVFVAFLDEDDDGEWDRGIVSEGDEPVVGLAPDQAIVFLESRGASPAFDPRLLRAVPTTGYSVVDVVRAADGRVVRLEALGPSDPRVVRVDMGASLALLPSLENP